MTQLELEILNELNANHGTSTWLVKVRLRNNGWEELEVKTVRKSLRELESRGLVKLDIYYTSKNNLCWKLA